MKLYLAIMWISLNRKGAADRGLQQFAVPFRLYKTERKGHYGASYKCNNTGI